MNENEPINRLRDGASANVKALLDSAGADEPTADELADLDQRVAPQLGGGGGGGGGGASLAKWVGGVGSALVVAAVTAWLLLSTPTPTAAPPPEAPPPKPVATAPAPPPPSPAADEQPKPPPEPAKAPAPPPRATKAPPAAPARDAVDELALLDAAQAALQSGDVTGCLDRVAEHERDFPSGALVQEREVLAIEALLKRGDREAGEARAARFLSQFDSSVHRGRVRALLADAGS